MTTDGLDYDIVVIGAGFAGMYAVHAFRSRGYRVHAYEAGSDVGGTWYWNRYPGARCDVESRSYSYSFDPELLQDWTWSERYPSQPEILDYARHVADRHDLRGDITFGTRVRSAWFDDRTTTWTITTDRGDQVRARYCVTAVGCLSATQIPQLPGLDRFRGEVHHTGNWTGQAEQDWRRHVDDVAATRLYRHANSWYVGANIPGKPRVILPYTGGFGAYSQRCDEVTRAGYAGFRLGRC